MINWIQRKRNKKGFTLIELIVVIAILGILAAIAIPRFSDLRASSAIKADGATAAQIVAAARIQETETGFKVTTIVQPDTEVAPTKDAAALQKKYMTVPTTSQSGAKGVFSISGGGTGNYIVTWVKETTGNYTYTENKPFNPAD